MIDLSKNLKASFAHVKQIANTGADSLEGVDHQRTHISLVDFIYFFLVVVFGFMHWGSLLSVLLSFD